MFTIQVPVCARCLHRSDTVRRLDQHAYAIKVTCERQGVTRGESRATGNISLHHPLDPRSDFSPRDPLKQPDSLIPSGLQKESSLQPDALHRRPAWMNLLPSNVNNEVRPPAYSAMQRRLTFPYFQSTRLLKPFSTPPEYPVGDTKYASAMSTAVHGIPEESRRASEPSQTHLASRLSSPHSYAVAGRRHRQNLHLHQDTTNPDFHDPSSRPHERHEPSESPSHTRSTRTPMVAGQRPPSISSRRSSRRQTSLRKYSSARADFSCTEHAQTPTAEQTATPAKPPFYKELSSFFATRAGR